MKKISLLLLLAVTVFFTACQLEKRHYRNGYYVNWNKDRKSTEKAIETETQQSIVAVTNTDNAAVNSTEATPVNSESTEIVAAQTNSNGNEQVANTTEPTSTMVPAIVNNKAVTKAKHNLRQLPVTKAPVSADDDKVLLIILAILLPPLAMYLYEGSWTSRCTLNLILTLLCGLPGMIHALIVIIGGK